MADGVEDTDAVGVAVAQFAPGRDRDENLATIHDLTRVAVARGARLVVFPEYSSFFVDPVGAEFVEASETLDGSFVSALAELAASEQVHIVAGMSESVEDAGRFSNTLVAVSPAGERVAVYRKQHLYDAFGARESEWVQAGSIETPETFELGGLTVGMQTCYDIRFPEVTRRLADAGADVVLVPAEWVRGPLKEHHWRTFVTARALENTMYLVAADHAPPSGVGSSMIVDPMGVPLASMGEQHGVAVAWLSPARIAETRQRNPSLVLRRYRVEPGR